MYVRKKKLTHNVDKGSSVTMQKMHTHPPTHTLYRLIGVKDKREDNIKFFVYEGPR